MGAHLRTDQEYFKLVSMEGGAAATSNATAEAGKAEQQAGESEAELRKLATDALKAMQSKPGLSADSMSKSPSTEILENYNQQPLHVRSRAEQWELPRKEIQLTDKLGEGDGGVIYHAHWRGLDVVAKMLKADTDRASNIDSDVAKADLINEISVLSRLRHPNLVMFLGACTIGVPLIILNEYMSGGNLEEYLISKRKEQGGKAWQPPPKLVLQWSIELARALCFLHNCSPIIIHRDLKPANLLLNEDCHLKVGDFGLSKVKDLQKLSGTYRMTGKTGSMRYMAPEVYQDDPQYDEKVDIYSSGLILWYISLGERPFDRVPAEVVAEKAARSGLRPNLEPVRVRFGPEFADLVAQAWHGDPAQRPSAGQMVELLEQLGQSLKTAKAKGKQCAVC